MCVKTLVAILATAAAASVCSGAAAATLPAGFETLSTTVQVGDLNLNNDAGARKALARIAFAAHSVCGEAGNNVDLRHRAQYRACISQTVEHTLTQLDSSRVSEIYVRPPRMTLAAYSGN
jgi:UrcA family protein